MTLHSKHIIQAFLIGLVASIATAEDTGSQIDDLMVRYYDLGQFNGTALVVDDDAVVLRKGYGFANIGWNASNTPTTRFLIGSVTKSFTALVVLRLEEEGSLNLNASVSDYLPKYREDTGRRLKLRHLLTHTDGLPNYTSNSSFWRSHEFNLPLTTNEFVRRYCSGDLVFEPGTQYRYGNSGYSILGAIVERVTDDTFSNVLSRLILDPLAMGSTGLYAPATIIKEMAAGYERAPGGLRPADPVHEPLFAAGSLYSTVDDLIAFDRALRGGSAFSDAVLEELFESRKGAVEQTFAYGWNVGTLDLDGAIDETRYMTTNGEINGYNAVVFRLPDRRALVVLLNNSGETVLFEIATNILRLLHGLPAKAPESRLRDVFLSKLNSESVAAAIAFYREKLNESREDSLFFPWPMRITAGQFIADGRHDDAIALLELNLHTNPTDSRSFELLAIAQLRSGKVAAAEESLVRALSIDSSSEYAASELSRLRSK